MNSPKYHALLIVAIIAAAVAVLIVDLMTELGVAGGVPYVGVVWLGYWGRDRRWIWIVAGGCCALTVLGYFLSPPGGEAWKVLVNRSLALFAIGVTATLCDVARRAHLQLRQSEQELQRRVEQRTAQLSRSIAELQFAHPAVQSASEEEIDKSSIVRETGDKLAGIESFDDTMDLWAQQARTLVGAHQSAVSYIPHGNFAEGKHAISLSDKYANYRTYDVLPTGDGIWGLVAKQKLSFCMTNEELESHPGWKNFSNMLDDRGLEHPPMRGWLAVPILRRDQEFVGVIQLTDKYEGEFRQQDLEVLTRLSGLMAPAFSLQYANEELQRHSEELAEAKAALERSNQFAYVVSHDLKEPLRAVTGFSQLLRIHSQGKLDEQADQDVTMIVDGAARMDRLINDLLDYSRITKKEKPLPPTDMNEVFELAMKNLQVAVEQSGAVVTCRSLPTLVVNQSQLVSLIQNLIGNAIKYRSDSPPEIHVSAEQGDDGWLFSIRDNGIGIDQRHLDSVFEVFRTLQAKDKDSGTGIGLAICKKIVEVHGGRIWAESEPGNGSAFYFTIPIK